MNFFAKYKRTIALFVLLFFSAAAITGCVCALTLAAAESMRLTVVIDAGHGGIDGGVVGITSGERESDVNLDLAKRLKATFEEAGFTAVLTRETQAGLYGAATAGYKRRDMQKRAEIIAQSAPVMVISVHQNYFSLHSRRGAQVFFRESSDRGRALAESIQARLNAMPECVKRTNALKGDYYILNCSDYPSVIVECGFLSNEEDEKLLLTAEYRARLAQEITAGALAFLLASASG